LISPKPCAGKTGDCARELAHRAQTPGFPAYGAERQARRSRAAAESSCMAYAVREGACSQSADAGFPGIWRGAPSEKKPHGGGVELHGVCRARGSL